MLGDYVRRDRVHFMVHAGVVHVMVARHRSERDAGRVTAKERKK